MDLQKYRAKICYTAAGFLVRDGKVLLVHHKKLNFWLAPGGHIEENELPHQAAEREFWEETGVRAQAVSSEMMLSGVDSEYVPTPVCINLHWISKENYTARTNGKTIDTRVWNKGCEQHVVFVYMMKAPGRIVLTRDPNESLGIGWFGERELKTLKTTDDIRAEAKLAIAMAKKR